MNLGRKINSLWTVVVNNQGQSHFTTRHEARDSLRTLKANGATNVYITQRTVGTPVRRR